MTGTKIFNHLRFVLILLLVWPIYGFSQANQSNQVTDSLAAQIKPIPTAQIIQNIVESNNEIQQANLNIAPKRNLIRIDSLYPEYAELINDKKEYTNLILESSPAKREIESQISTWLGYQNYLNSWVVTINNYLGRNAIINEQLHNKDKIWDLTYQTASQEELPAEVLQRVKTTYENYLELDKTIDSYTNHYLKLESDITDLIVTIDNIINSLTDLRNSDIYDLFHLRHEALWKELLKDPSEASQVKSRTASIKENVSRIKDFFKSHENTFYLTFVLLVIYISSIWMLIKAFKKFAIPEKRKSLQMAKSIIIDRPIWVILFLYLITIRILIDNLPRLFDDVLVLLFLILGFAVIRPHIQARFRNLPLVIIFVILFGFCKFYIELTAFQYRLYILLEAVLVLAGTIYFIRPYQKTKSQLIYKLDQVLLGLSQLLIIFAAVSLVSNILGYSNLANYMLKVTTQAIDSTFIFYAIYLIVDSIVLGLIHSRFNRNLLIKHSNRQLLEVRALKLTNTLIFLLWLYYFLISADLYQPIAEFLTGFLAEPYRIGSITFTLGMLVTFVLILIISFTLTSLISFFLDGNEVQLDFIKLPKGVPAAVSLVIRYFILTVGFVLAISSLGIELSKFNLLAGALGLGIGFGLQTVVSNFISGIILVFERPIMPGDIVEVNNLLGTVNKIGVRASKITTFDGSEVVVPNNNLISNDLINWTLSDNIRRVEIFVGTSYDSDPNQVINVLKEIASAHESVLKNPSPMALLLKFGQSSIDFRLLFWVYVDNLLSTKSDINVAIYNRFKELGIKIPFPQRVVHLPDQDNSKDV